MRKNLTYWDVLNKKELALVGIIFGYLVTWACRVLFIDSNLKQIDTEIQKLIDDNAAEDAKLAELQLNPLSPAALARQEYHAHVKPWVAVISAQLDEVTPDLYYPRYGFGRYTLTRVIDAITAPDKSISRFKMSILVNKALSDVGLDVYTDYIGKVNAYKISEVFANNYPKNASELQLYTDIKPEQTRKINDAILSEAQALNYNFNSFKLAATIRSRQDYAAAIPMVVGCMGFMIGFQVDLILQKQRLDKRPRLMAQ